MTANSAARYLDDGDVQLYHGDAITVLQSLPSGIAQTCITSPPYWGLRDYGTGTWTGGNPNCDHPTDPKPERKFTNGRGEGQGDDYAGSNLRSWTTRDATPASGICKCGAQRVDDQLGLEATPQEYVERIVSVFREVRRVLRDDGTCWINLGDSYATGTGTPSKPSADTDNGYWQNADKLGRSRIDGREAGLKPKDLVGIPWMVARAMQAPYYTGRIAAERDRVWLAATIDAEGSICGFHHERSDGDGTRTGIHLQITNSSMALLDEAHRIWPTSRADHNPHGNGHLGKREIRRWIAHNVDDKALLLRELYPYLIAKRQQALLAWNFLEMSKVSKRIGKLAEGREAKARRSWIVHALSALNRGDAIDVPGWIVEPPALYEPGWYLRSDIIWSKPNPMPESVTDRPTKAHEYLFLLTKQPRYFYDADAIREPHSREWWDETVGTPYLADEHRPRPKGGSGDGGKRHGNGTPAGRNRRSVWTIPTEPFPEAHFATYPQELVRPCILAGTSERGGCVECGAPWRRVTEQHRNGRDWNANNRAGGDRKVVGQSASESMPNDYQAPTTVGWEPSCSCALSRDGTDWYGTSTPQLVLDPFVGSGTTALVARKHGRRCIGIDLSLEYLAIAAKRTQQLSLLGGVA